MRITEEMTESFGIFDTLAGSLTLKGKHAVGGIAYEDRSAFVPGWQSILWGVERVWLGFFPVPGIRLATDHIS